MLNNQHFNNKYDITLFAPFAPFCNSSFCPIFAAINNFIKPNIGFSQLLRHMKWHQFRSKIAIDIIIFIFGIAYLIKFIAVYVCSSFAHYRLLN